jgi:hypothetical protein
MGQASESYCTLIRWLAERNRLSSVELRYILRSPEPVNPGDLLLNSTSIDVHAIKVAYRRLTERGLDWKTIQERLADIIEYRLWLEKNRQNARKETELLYPIGDLVMKPNIGILWCTFFQRRSWLQLSLRLADAYRPPSLFASVMKSNGHDVEFLVCDEFLDVADLNGTKRKLPDDVELLYFLSHGELVASGFEALLHSVNWQPGGAPGIGNGKLAVAVFDTCHLINSSKNKNAQSVWGGATLGTSLRLLLGFDGPANIDPDMAKRGKAFAENLIQQKTFADAWIQAVNSTSQSNKPVAIGIGDSMTSASSVLNTASLTNMPAPRPAGPPVFCERY